VYLPRYGSILIDVGIIAFSISTRRTCKSRFLFVFHTGSTSDLSPLIISVRVMGSNKNHNLFRAGVGAPRLNNYHLDARRFGIIGPMTAVNFTTSRLNPDKMSTKAPATLPKSSTVRRFLPTRTSSIPSTGFAVSTILCHYFTNFMNKLKQQQTVNSSNPDQSHLIFLTILFSSTSSKMHSSSKSSIAELGPGPPSGADSNRINQCHLELKFLRMANCRHRDRFKSN
jgi:hypothetical protein